MIASLLRRTLMAIGALVVATLAHA